MKKLFRFKELLAIIVVLITLFQKLKLPGIVIPTIDPHLLNIIVLLIGILFFSTLYNNYFLIEKSHGEIKKKTGST
jgi:hypothetical protein